VYTVCTQYLHLTHSPSSFPHLLPFPLELAPQAGPVPLYSMYHLCLTLRFLT
jgi:hypothetical protein